MKNIGLSPAALLVLLPAIASPVFASAQKNTAADAAYVKALLLENQGNSDAALKAYRKAIDQDPASAYLRRQAARLALLMNHPRLALSLARQTVAIDSSSAQDYVILGRAEWGAGDMDAAEAAFAQALRLDSSSMDAAVWDAEMTAAGAAQKAESIISDFITKNPGKEAPARYELATIEIRAGDLGRARKNLKIAQSLDPEIDDIEGRYALAQAYEIKSDTRDALGQYDEILSAAGPDAAILDHIADLFLSDGDAADAAKNFAQARKISPSDPEADQWFADDAARRGDFSQAAIFIESSAALGEDPALSLRLSYYLTQSDRIPDAAAVLEKAHSLWPRNVEISYFLALGRLDLGQTANAAALLRQVLKEKPAFRDARYQLASILESEIKMAASE